MHVLIKTTDGKECVLQLPDTFTFMETINRIYNTEIQWLASEDYTYVVHVPNICTIRLLGEHEV